MRKKLPQISDGNINVLSCITVWKILAWPASDLFAMFLKDLKPNFFLFILALFVNFKAKQA
jgi:hypothetical protein